MNVFDDEEEEDDNVDTSVFPESLATHDMNSWKLQNDEDGNISPREEESFFAGR